MKSSFSEGRFLFYTVSSIFLLMAIHFFSQPLYSIYNPNDYVGIHTLLETFSISISMTIFFYGLKNFKKTKSSRMLLVSFTFLIVALLDSFHMISYKGMPDFLTDSSVAKATWFWVISRTINALFMLMILILPDRKLKRDLCWLVVFSGSLVSILIGYIVIHFEQRLPVLVIEGQGPTNLKNGIEYIVCMIGFFTLIVALYQYYIEKEMAKLAIALGMVFLLITELIFTIYQSVYDLDNFSGHIFKAFGFYFILKGFYFAVSNQELKQKIEPENQKMISKLPGFIFKAVKRGNDFIGVYWEGELLEEIGLKEEELLGLSLSKVFPSPQTAFIEYCRLSWKLNETAAFKMEYYKRSLLVSIKPYVDVDQNEVILGTAIDMTGIHREPPIQQKVENDQQSVRIVM